MDGNVIQNLLASRKAVVTFVAVVAAVSLGFANKVSGQEVLDFVKWVITTWLGAQAAEDVAKKINITRTTNTLSLTPPASPDVQAPVIPSTPPPPAI